MLTKSVQCDPWVLVILASVRLSFLDHLSVLLSLTRLKWNKKKICRMIADNRKEHRTMWMTVDKMWPRHFRTLRMWVFGLKVYKYSESWSHHVSLGWNIKCPVKKIKWTAKSDCMVVFTHPSRRGQMRLLWTRRTALRKSLRSWCQHLHPASKLLPRHLQSLTLTVPGRKTEPQLATKVRESQRVFFLARSVIGESVFI